MRQMQDENGNLIGQDFISDEDQNEDFGEDMGEEFNDYGEEDQEAHMVQENTEEDLHGICNEIEQETDRNAQNDEIE